MNPPQAPVSRREMIHLIEDNIRTLERVIESAGTALPMDDTRRMLEVYRVISLVLHFNEIPEYPTHDKG